MDSLFTLENGEIVIQQNILNNKDIKALIRRDRGGLIAGDMKGLKKERAFAELGLIWYCVNLNSPGLQKGLSGDELVKDGMDYFGLPKEWKPDDVFDRVYKQYDADYNSNITVQAIRSIHGGLNRAIRMLDKITAILNQLEDKVEMDMNDVSNFNKANKEMIDMSASLPETINKLKALEAIYLKEEKKIKSSRGGKTITLSMDPDK